MIKNAVIAILLSALWHTTMCDFNWFTFLSLAAVLFFVVWTIEDAIDSFKRKLVFKRRVNKQIDNIKIPQPRRPKQVS